MSRLSLNASLRIPIVLIGVLAIVLTLTTGRIYQELTLEEHQLLVKRTTDILVDDQIEHLRRNATDLGLTLQHDSGFRKAFGERDTETLRFLLNDQFHQYFATTDLIRLEKVMAFDSELQPVEESDEGTHPPRGSVCPGILELARRRAGAARLKPLDEICLLDGRPYHAVLVPIGGLKLNGYLAVLTDPSHSLRSLDQMLGSPVQISLPSGEPLFATPGWQPADGTNNRLVIRYQFLTTDQQPALTVSVADDITTLSEKLRRTLYLVTLLAGAAMAMAMVLARLWIRADVLSPMRQLMRHMRLIISDRRRSRHPVPESGSRDLRQFAADFNTVTGELSELHQRLEQSAYQDGLTRLPNRVLFYDRLEQLTRLCERQQSGFALLMINLSEPKKIDDSRGHDAGDLLLREVTKRLTRELRRADNVIAPTCDTLARLGDHEFAVILPEVGTPEQAILVANKLREAAQAPFAVADQRVEIRMSIGIAIYPVHGRDCDALVRYADQSMVEAKRSGLGVALAAS